MVERAERSKLKEVGEMKYRTTKKAVMNGYQFVIKAGNCNLQHLLCREDAIAYTTRREGWAADIYEFANVAIVTGYAPFGNVRPSYDVQKKYDNAAEKIRDDRALDFLTQKNALRKLIAEFIEEVTQ